MENYDIISEWVMSSLDPKKRYAATVRILKVEAGMLHLKLFTAKRVWGLLGSCNEHDIKYDFKRKAVVGRFRVCNRIELVEAIRNILRFKFSNCSYGTQEYTLLSGGPPINGAFIV